MIKNLSNRFISSYNSIDKNLRLVYNFNSHSSFSEVVRKCAVNSVVVRKYQNELLDYARLRNAIVHSLDDSMTIAEPHQSVVEHIEHIERLICTPPKISLYYHKATKVNYSMVLDKVINLMANSNYSNVPVVKDGNIIGVVTNKMIVEAIAKTQIDLDTYVKMTMIEDILQKDSLHYCIENSSVTIDAVQKLFSENRRLAIMLFTDNGQNSGELQGVITIGDLQTLNKVMEKY